jgi:hypothetical protein
VVGGTPARVDRTSYKIPGVHHLFYGGAYQVLDVPTGLRLKVTAGWCVMHTEAVDSLCGEKRLTLHTLSL